MRKRRHVQTPEEAANIRDRDSANLEDESVKSTNETGVVILKCHDKLDIRMLAKTYAGGDHVMQVQTAAGRFVCVNLREYLQQTDGRCRSQHIVPLIEKLRAYYGVGRAGRRWWKYLFWGLNNMFYISLHGILILTSSLLYKLCIYVMTAMEAQEKMLSAIKSSQESFERMFMASLVKKD